MERIPGGRSHLEALEANRGKGGEGEIAIDLIIAAQYRWVEAFEARALLRFTGETLFCLAAGLLFRFPAFAGFDLPPRFGFAMQARAVLLMVGERPGLSSPDSLGLYLTYDPKIGRDDSERNCISNIRPEGLGFELAAFKLAWLLREAFARKLTGVRLKDESDLLLSDGRPPTPRLG